MNPSRFERNHEQAQRSARAQIEFIVANIDKLAGGGRSYLAVVMNFDAMARRGERFTPHQLSFIDSLYERVMKGAGLPSVPLHIDRKKKGLKFG